jgi:hypothetical protein
MAMGPKTVAGLAASVAFAIISTIAASLVGSSWSWPYLALLVGIAAPASIVSAQFISRLLNDDSLAGLGTITLGSFGIFGAMGIAIFLFTRHM